MPQLTKPATKQLESFNPATGELVGAVDTVAPAAVPGIFAEVAQVQQFWASLTLKERARYIKRLAKVVLNEVDSIDQLLVKEQGKPRNEAFSMEIFPTIDGLHWLADNAPKLLADERISTPQMILKAKRSYFTYEPLGVIGIISPWNYPWSIPFTEIAFAVMAGNGVVLKPASATPLISERIREVFEKAGFPPGLVRVVHGDGVIGEAVVNSADKIFFTGSVEVGRHVGELCAHQLKQSVLELGGKDPAIVLEDAQLNHTIAGITWAGFGNAGQSCAGIERVYVHRSIADRFIAGLVEAAEGLKIGDPLDWNTEVGPMTLASQRDLVAELVDDAVAHGAKMLCGGPTEVEGLSGAFYKPTVLVGVNHSMRIMQEEIFGPVVPVMIVDSIAEAVRLANDSQFGLGASVWTRDRAQGELIARQIESGMVWINDHMYSHGACQCNWSGVKNSGVGRTHSKFGLYECVNIRLRVWEPALLKNPWWHPYDHTMGRAMRAFSKLIHGSASGRHQALTTERDALRTILNRARRRRQ